MKKVLTAAMFLAAAVSLSSVGAQAQLISVTQANYAGPYACTAEVSPEINNLITFCETHRDDTFCRGISFVNYGGGIPLGERFTEQYKVVPNGDGTYANGKLRIQLDQGCDCLFTLHTGDSRYSMFSTGYGFENLDWQPYLDQCGGYCSNLPAFTDNTSFFVKSLTSSGTGLAQGTSFLDNNLNGLGEAGSGHCREMVLHTP